MTDAAQETRSVPGREAAPSGLPPGWSSRVPDLADVPALVALRAADREPFTGSASVDERAVVSEVAGIASWTRRQLVAVDGEGRPRAWVVVHDRAAGRTMVYLYLDRSLAEPEGVAAVLYAWAEERGRALCRLRGVEATRLDASPFADDEQQRSWLAAAGYDKRRSWPQMTRPVLPEEASSLSSRPGVSVRRVGVHDNGMPVAADLQLVHEILESSFEDHFNSYRESFPEFVQRLREDPGHRWDHWWLAFVDGPDRPLAAGTVVSTVLGPNAAGREGSYIDYIGVHRHARGRGVAKALLHTVIADAAERGRDRVGLEVDAESPTGADQLYRSMGWEENYVIESWFKDIEASA